MYCQYQLGLRKGMGTESWAVAERWEVGHPGWAARRRMKKRRRRRTRMCKALLQ